VVAGASGGLARTSARARAARARRHRRPGRIGCRLSQQCRLPGRGQTQAEGRRQAGI